MKPAPPHKQRCPWCKSHPLYIRYHDTEWGTPLYNDNQLFAYLILESAQTGLNWLTVLKKRAGYDEVFHHFNPEKIARFNKSDVQRLLLDNRIIRHRKKIESTINNAQAFLTIQERYGSFSWFLWRLVDHHPIQNQYKRTDQIPVHTTLSNQLSKILKQNGFSFLGPTTCYAYMQAIGMVNDHLISCFRYHEVQQHTSTIQQVKLPTSG
ncbi:DNA-3-methyladenine glycosylase 1 [invertebrate metagenome]|uniref:DNA-3-methyladenine glycosylase 1 n=1 Tax=invertebrate metagenome TaxID=1711999 RepID=A0A2H9T5N6_9ZZZZ